MRLQLPAGAEAARTGPSNAQSAAGPHTLRNCGKGLRRGRSKSQWLHAMPPGPRPGHHTGVRPITSSNAAAALPQAP